MEGTGSIAVKERTVWPGLLEGRCRASLVQLGCRDRREKESERERERERKRERERERDRERERGRG